MEEGARGLPSGKRNLGEAPPCTGLAGAQEPARRLRGASQDARRSHSQKAHATRGRLWEEGAVTEKQL